MWVEVRVEDDNGVCSVKVDANTTSPRGQHVDEDVRVRFVEFVDALLAERAWRITILRGRSATTENNQLIPAPVEGV